MEVEEWEEKEEGEAVARVWTLTHPTPASGVYIVHLGEEGIQGLAGER